MTYTTWYHLMYWYYMIWYDMIPDNVIWCQWIICCTIWCSLVFIFLLVFDIHIDYLTWPFYHLINEFRLQMASTKSNMIQIREVFWPPWERISDITVTVWCYYFITMVCQNNNLFILIRILFLFKSEWDNTKFGIIDLKRETTKISKFSISKSKSEACAINSGSILIGGWARELASFKYPEL